jgi:putrescine aminotransferase
MEERSIADLQRVDAAHHIHPFSNLKSAKSDISQIIERAEGCYIWDVHGNRYLDGMAGICNVQIGYGRIEMADAAESVNEFETEWPEYLTNFG